VSSHDSTIAFYAPALGEEPALRAHLTAFASRLPQTMKASITATDLEHRAALH
jgi:hypothetical protein